jgi:CDP-paratose 2-epimerase
LLELFAMLEKKLNIKMEYKQLPWRESDQKVFVADIEKAKKVLGWEPKITADEGVTKMVNWLME